MAPSPSESNATGETCLCVRLWNGTETGGGALNANAPAVCLVRDLILASQGQLSEPRGQLLVGTFSGIDSAILATRRLQWAMQGFSDSDKTGHTKAAILVYDADELSDPEFAGSVQLCLEQAVPGQILISSKSTNLLQNIPSLQMQAVPESALCELLWRNSAIPSDPSSDENALSAFIKQNGLQDDAPPAPEPPALAPALDSKRTKAPGAYAPVVIQERSDFNEPGAFRRINPRLLFGAGGGAVLLAVIAFFAFSHRGPALNQVPEPGPAAVSPPQTDSGDSPATFRAPQDQPSISRNQSANTPPTTKRTIYPPLQKGHNKTGGASDTAGETKAPAQEPQVNRAGCDLEPSDIPKLLAQADQRRGAGDYDSATRQYNHVRACEPGNAKANEGLRLIRIAKHGE